MEGNHPRGREVKGRPGLSHLFEEPVGRSLMALFLPVLAANAMQSINSLISTIILGRTLGESAFAAAITAGQVYQFLAAAAYGFSMVASIMVGQAVGAQKTQSIGAILASASALFVVLGSLEALGAIVVAPAVMVRMGLSGSESSEAVLYMRISCCTLPPFFLLSLVLSGLRAVGKARIGCNLVLLQLVLNVSLMPVLIRGLGAFPEMGMVGAAAAMFSSTTGVAIFATAYLIAMGRREGWIDLKARKFGARISIVATMLEKGLALSFQQVLVSGAALSLMGVVNHADIRAGAAYGAVLQIWTYVQMPALALGAAISTVGAQRFGANQIDGVGRVAWLGAVYAFILTLTPAVLTVAFGNTLLPLFLPKAEGTIQYALHINSIGVWASVMFGIGVAFSAVLRSAGVVWLPFWLTIVALWGVRVPFAYLIEPTIGLDAVWVSLPISSAVLLLALLAYFRWGNWRCRRLLGT